MKSPKKGPRRLAARAGSERKTSDATQCKTRADCVNPFGPAIPDAPLLMSRKATARMLGISLGTLDTWVKQGIIPTFRVGRVVRFRRDAINQWIKDREGSAR